MEEGKFHKIDEGLHRIRHSLAHILAEAVQQYRPGTKLGFGPPIDDGLYYDFILPQPITEEDFPHIEKIMRKIIAEGKDFVREELSHDQALQRIENMGEPYKKEYAEELFQKKSLETLSFYKSGEFLDMCEGPHVMNTKEIRPDCFKLRSVSGAYWRGNSKNAMMTRIYAWAFANKDELKTFIRNYEEGLKRDHKKLGKDLEIFAMDEEIGKGLPLWLPNGTVIRDELEKLMKELEFKAHYQRVSTPEISKIGLYYKTGHFPYYKDHIFPIMEIHKEKEGDSLSPSSAEEEDESKKEAYCLRPMNCPHHHRIYALKLRSYRELPIRLAEYGKVYRYEDSGTLSGLLRVRSMCMNDAHIYCRPDQVKEEFQAVMQMHKKVYDILGITSFYMRLSEWDPEDPKKGNKYVDNPEAWDKSQKLIREAMMASGIDFTVEKGEAAFYGPKIDIQFRSVTGREETASTSQLDFAIPERLGMTYVDADNQEKHPYIIHRAPLGTHERFIAFLIEHYGGAFPTWLAPTQVKIISVSEKFQEYSDKVMEELRDLGIRAEVDNSLNTFNKKIRLNIQQKIPNLLIIGEQEQQSGQVTVRRYGQEKQKTLPLEEFKNWIQGQIKNRVREAQDF